MNSFIFTPTPNFSSLLCQLGTQTTRSSCLEFWIKRKKNICSEMVLFHLFKAPRLSNQTQQRAESESLLCSVCSAFAEQHTAPPGRHAASVCMARQRKHSHAGSRDSFDCQRHPETSGVHRDASSPARPRPARPSSRGTVSLNDTHYTSSTHT